MKNVIEYLNIDNTKDDWRYSLNISSGINGKPIYDFWINHKDDTGFAHWSHYGDENSKGRPKRNYQDGFKNLGFVRIPGTDDKWLLVDACKILYVPMLDKKGNGSPCEVEPIPELQKYIGKLIVSYHRGNKYNRYVFKLSSSGHKLMVEEH